MDKGILQLISTDDIWGLRKEVLQIDRGNNKLTPLNISINNGALQRYRLEKLIKKRRTKTVIMI